MLQSNDGLTANDGYGPEWGDPISRPQLHDEDEYPAARLGPEQRMIRAGQELIDALMAFEDEAARYQDEPLACLEMDDAMKSLSNMSGRLKHELDQWGQAMRLIENDTQISPTSPKGVHWRSYLSPKWLLYFADLAKPGDTGYIPQLLSRLGAEGEREREREREMSMECGRATKSGDPCQAIPVFWPGRGRDTGCSRHLSAEEKTELSRIWSMIEANHGCPGCKAPQGVPCDEAAKLHVLPSGVFPRARTFAGTMLHDARLALGAPAAK